MKRYLSDFKLSYEFVRNSIYECLNRQRWTRRDTSYMLAEYVQKWTFQYTNKFQSKYKIAKNIRRVAYNNKTKLYKLADFMAQKMYEEIIEKKIDFPNIKYEKRIDAGSLKIREIGVASMKQQCFDYIAVNACKKMFLAKIGHYQCASLSTKGQVFGKSAIETWIRTNPEKCKYVWKGDISKFYPSVNHNILKSLLKRDIKNKTILYLLYTLIDTYREGLCIGSYLSQYLANYYLSYAYHYTTEFLYTERRGKRNNLVSHILFYMDDIIMFSPNKKNLKMASRKLEKYLNEKLSLKLKPTYQLFPLDSRPIDMMGFKIYTYKTTVRKRIFVKANRLYLRVKRNNYNMNLLDAYRVVSYNGYFRHSYSFKYIQKMNLEKTLKRAKEVISNERSNIHK